MVCKSALISVFFAQDMTISTLASMLEDSLSLRVDFSPKEYSGSGLKENEVLLDFGI